MKRINFEIFIKLLPVFLISFIISAGAKNEPPQDETMRVFAQIETSINGSDISAISKFISSQTYLSLSNGETGYFSAVQSYYIIQDFFKNYKVISFKFRSVNNSESPYGIGTLVYEYRNKRVNAQVFVSLSQSGNDWLISQFTVK